MSGLARFSGVVLAASIAVVTLAAVHAYAEYRESIPPLQTIPPSPSTPSPSSSGAQEAKPAEAKPAPVAVPAKIEDFDWLAGRWVGALQKSRAEEIWSKADAGLMMGMFRLVSNEGKTNVIEIMTLRQVGESVEMRLRHMNEQLTTWEPVDQSGVLILTRKGDGEFEFSSPTPGEIRRGQPLRQTWKVAGDTLRFEVFAMRDGSEKKILDGETKRVAFDARP